MNNSTFEIGELVEWSISGRIRKGIFRQMIDGKAEVICTQFETRTMSVKCLVDPKIIRTQNAEVA